ncbi:MAG TPA: DUF4388 domain-containing protein [Thermoanaerobaculia bacterium]|nr:DUF4388 domain-containing protein [Thermoanaerobaculia bacterium]
MALEGTLRDFSLADILQLIALQHKTGLLSVRSPGDTVTLGFADGQLVSAESSAQRLDTRLGTVLVKTRRLAPELLARALEMQAQTLQRLGFILLKNGFCSAQDLRDGLDIQIRRIVYGLFRWTDGDYVFEQTDHVDYDSESTTPISVERLLMEGARMLDEWPIVEKVVWSLDLVYQKVPVAQPVIPAEDEDEVEVIEDTTLARRARDKRLDPIRVSRAEWSVYELVDGQRSVAELNELAFLSEFDGCKAFFDLVSRGLIEEAAPRVVEAPDDPGVPIGTAPAARAPRAPLDLNVISVVVLLLVLLAAVRLQSKNPLNLLTLPPRRDAVLQGYEKSVSLQKLRRLAEGVDTFTLLSGRLPEGLDTLVASQIVQARDLDDPWGTKYRYIVQGEKFYLVGFDPEGHTDPDLLFSRTLVLRESKEQELAPHSTREITVVE